jgi:hypothetical protein
MGMRTQSRMAGSRTKGLSMSRCCKGGNFSERAFGFHLSPSSLAKTASDLALGVARKACRAGCRGDKSGVIQEKFESTLFLNVSVRPYRSVVGLDAFSIVVPLVCHPLGTLGDHATRMKRLVVINAFLTYSMRKFPTLPLALCQKAVEEHHVSLMGSHFQA